MTFLEQLLDAILGVKFRTLDLSDIGIFWELALFKWIVVIVHVAVRFLIIIVSVARAPIVLFMLLRVPIAVGVRFFQVPIDGRNILIY